jgi:hypothetical protein
VLIPLRACTAILYDLAGLCCDFISVRTSITFTSRFRGNFLWQSLLFLLHVGRPLWRVDESVICSTATYWLESHRIHNHILPSHLGLPQPGGPGPRIYIPQEQGSSVIPPGTGFPFCCLLRLAGVWWSYSNSPVSVILLPTVSRQSTVSGTHLGPATNFSHSLFDYFLGNLGFVGVGCPLWREVGSVLFSFCRASPAQPFSDLIPTGLVSTVYCLYLWDSPNLEGQVLVFIPPRKRVGQLYPRVLGLTHLRSRSHITTEVSRPVRLSVLPLLEQVTRCYIYLSDNYFLYFSCRAPSLTRGRVCKLQCNDASSISSYIATDGLSASSS